jgi:5-methylthioadenosine/S-adenosylhomocysteine deaminase
MSILIKDCDWIVTENATRDVLQHASVLIDHGEIVEIGEVKRGADRVIEGAGKLLMPGLINCHTHLSMTLLRGYADDMVLQDWLTTKIWPLESMLTSQACYYGALLGCLEMIKSGTTTFMDMYFFMEDVARAVKESGLRAVLSYGMIDLFEPERGKREIEKTNGFIGFLKAMNCPRITLALGPHAPYTCSEETLLWAKETAEREHALVQTHLAETRQEQARFQREKGMKETEYLHKIGFLSANLVAAHCVWLSSDELKILKETGVSVAHCPVSNMKLASGGVAPLPEMFEQQIPVGLGTDGASSNNTLDMFETMKICALLHKLHRWDPTVMPAQRCLDLATIEAARVLKLDQKIGSIEPGKQADLILLNMRSPYFVPIHGKDTVISDLVYTARSSNVNTTIVDGKILMHEGKVLTLDEDGILKKAQSEALKLISRAEA